MKLYQKPHPQTDATHPGLTMSANLQSDYEMLPFTNSKKNP